MPFCPSCGTQVGGGPCANCGSAAGGAVTPAIAAPLTENNAGALCYVGGLITGVIFLVLAPYNQNPRIKFHAFQSIFFNVVWALAWIALIPLGMLLPYGLSALLSGLSLVVSLGGMLLWLFLMWKAYQGQTLLLPLIGNFGAPAGWGTCDVANPYDSIVRKRKDKKRRKNKMIKIKSVVPFVLIALALAAEPSLRAADRMRAGLWETTATSDGKSSTRTSCVTSAMAASSNLSAQELRESMQKSVVDPSNGSCKVVVKDFTAADSVVVTQVNCGAISYSNTTTYKGDIVETAIVSVNASVTKKTLNVSRRVASPNEFLHAETTKSLRRKK